MCAPIAAILLFACWRALPIDETSKILKHVPPRETLHSPTTNAAELKDEEQEKKISRRLVEVRRLEEKKISKRLVEVRRRTRRRLPWISKE